MPDIHHLIGPSSYSQWSECPGSLIGPPKSDDGNDAADEGTACHKLLELVLRYKIDPKSMMHHVVTTPRWPVTEEMVVTVNLFRDLLKGISLELGIPESAWCPERHLIHKDIPDQLFGGTSDLTAYHNGTMLVMDLKYGRQPVKATSGQLTCYAILAAGNAPEGTLVNRIVQVIVQPRSTDGEQWTRYEPTADDLQRVWSAIVNAATVYRNNKHLPQPPMETLRTGKQCRYCPRQLGCPAMLRDLADADMGRHLPDMAGTRDEIARLTYWLERSDAIEEFVKKAKRRLLELKKAGVEIPGYKLIARFGHRQWKEGANVIPHIVTLGLNPEEATTTKVKSPAQIEALLKKQGRPAKELKALKEYLSVNLVERKPIGVGLVEADAKGTEVMGEVLQRYLDLLNKEESSDDDE